MSEPPKTKMVCSRLPLELVAKLEAQMKKFGHSRSTVIRRLLEKALKVGKS